MTFVMSEKSRFAFLGSRFLHLTRRNRLLRLLVHQVLERRPQCILLPLKPLLPESFLLLLLCAPQLLFVFFGLLRSSLVLLFELPQFVFGRIDCPSVCFLEEILHEPLECLLFPL